MTRTALIARVRRLLEDNQTVTRLTATYASSGAVTVTVADGTLFAANSILENQTTGELMSVSSVSGNNLTILAEGRAYRGSTAAAGAVGELIARDPRFSKDNIIEAINVALSNWCSTAFPRLVWDTSTGGNFSSTNLLVPCPTDSYTIERVCFIPDAYTDFIDVEFDALQTYPAAQVSTGLGVRVHYGRNVLKRRSWYGDASSPIDKAVKLLVGKRWLALETDAATIAAADGFPDDGDDLIVQGAALYLSGWRSFPRQDVTELAAARELNTGIPSINSLQAQQIAARSWALRAAEVAARRPVGAKPSKVWID